MFSRVADHYYRLTTESDSIKITDEHPVWVHNAKTIAGDCGLPLALTPDELADIDPKTITSSSAVGLIGEAKVNLDLERRGMTSISKENIDPNKLGETGTFNNEYAKYNGISGIDSILKGPDGKIYIIETKASGSKETKKTSGLGTTDVGKQMSENWLTDTTFKGGTSRIDNMELSKANKAAVKKGLDNKDGSVVRLYAAVNAKGEVRYYEISDVSKTNVKISRNEHQFGF